MQSADAFLYFLLLSAILSSFGSAPFNSSFSFASCIRNLSGNSCIDRFVDRESTVMELSRTVTAFISFSANSGDSFVVGRD